MDYDKLCADGRGKWNRSVSHALRSEYERAIGKLLDALPSCKNEECDHSGADIIVVSTDRLFDLFSGSLYGPLDLSTLTKRGIQSVNISLAIEQLYHDAMSRQSKAATSISLPIVYLSSSYIDDLESIVQHAIRFCEKCLQSDTAASAIPTLYLFFTGAWDIKRDSILAAVQRANPCFPSINREHVPGGFLTLDSDLLSLGHEHYTLDVSFRADTVSMINVSHALHSIQQLCGSFDTIKCKGKESIIVAKYLIEMIDEGNGLCQDRKKYSLILMDRSVDFVSVLTSALTYEDFLDTFFTCKDGVLQENKVSLKTMESDRNVPYPNAKDAIFTKIRSMRVPDAANYLQDEATQLKHTFQHFQMSAPNATVTEVNDFVKTFASNRVKQDAIEGHIALLEVVQDRIAVTGFADILRMERRILDSNVEDHELLQDFEHIIESKFDCLSLLRLLCLSGLVRDTFVKHLCPIQDSLKQVYGSGVDVFFQRLIQLHMVQMRTAWVNSGRNTFESIALDWNLVDSVPAAHTDNATDSEEYTPLTCRLVEEIVRSGSWLQKDLAIRRLYGPRAEMTLHSAAKQLNGSTRVKKPRPIVVLILGGTTFAEIAAVRRLSAKCESIKCIFATLTYFMS